MFRSILFVLMLLVATESWADFILLRDEHLDIVSKHTTGCLYHDSTAVLMPDGEVQGLNVQHCAKLQVLPGSKGDDFNVSDFGNVVILGGNIRTLSAAGYSTVDIFGGELWRLSTRHDSVVSISGGITTLLHLYADSVVSISGGTFGRIATHARSVVDISGGSFPDDVALYYHEDISCEGGEITFHGYDFRMSHCLVEDERIFGVGNLTGRWPDGTSCDVWITRNDGTIRVIPEPSTLILLTAAAVGLLAYVRRRRRS